MYNLNKNRYQIETVTLYDDIKVGSMYVYECGVSRLGGCYIHMTRVNGRKCKYIDSIGAVCDESVQKKVDTKLKSD